MKKSIFLYISLVFYQCYGSSLPLKQNSIEHEFLRDKVQLQKKLEIRKLFLNPVKENNPDTYFIKEGNFKRQNVSGAGMRCFFNAIGLEAEEEIKKLREHSSNLLIRQMIANEIISLSGTPAELPDKLKAAIKFTVYQEKQDQLNILRKKTVTGSCKTK